MSATIEIPIWLVFVVCALIGASIAINAKRDAAMLELFRLYDKWREQDRQP